MESAILQMTLPFSNILSPCYFLPEAIVPASVFVNRQKAVTLLLYKVLQKKSNFRPFFRPSVSHKRICKSGSDLLHQGQKILKIKNTMIRAFKNTIDHKKPLELFPEVFYVREKIRTPDTLVRRDSQIYERISWKRLIFLSLLITAK